MAKKKFNRQRTTFMEGVSSVSALYLDSKLSTTGMVLLLPL